MKMFKRIIATIAIVLSLCTIAWGESDVQAKYESAQKFLNEHIKTIDSDKKESARYHDIKHIFNAETNLFPLKDNLWMAKPEKKFILVGKFISCESIPHYYSVNISYKFPISNESSFWCFPIEDLAKNWKFDQEFISAERWIEFLGLNPKNYKDKEKSIMVFFLVEAKSLARPAYNPDIFMPIDKKVVAEAADPRYHSSLYHSYSEIYLTWKNDRVKESFFKLAKYFQDNEPENLCTRLGYTFDYNKISKYDSIDDFLGVAELIVADYEADMYLIARQPIEDVTKDYLQSLLDAYQ